MSEQKKLNENEIQGFLEGMGFEADVNKQGLYKKNLPSGANAFWDFRKTNKGSFYVTDAFEDGGAFWKDKDAKQIAEYVEVRKALGGEEKQKKEPKTDSPNPVSSLTVLESKNDAHTLMNIKDDSQVLLEIQGAFLEEFVYSFPTKEGKVTGLSWAGVKEVARRQGNVSVDEINITETPDTYRVLAKATDVSRHVSMYGVAEQSKRLKLKSGEFQDDIHSLSKCVSRAQRNALRSLIPEMTIKGLIEEYLKGSDK